MRMKIANTILLLAALYNIAWGGYTSLFPDYMLFGEAPSTLIMIYIRCIGMLVGVYGIAYYMASLDPVKYWPLILTGLIGKVLGPIGAFYYVYSGKLEANFLYINLFNDLIWIIPFSWILLEIHRGRLKLVSEQPVP